MGFHECEYCRAAGVDRPETSSGDVDLSFANGRRFRVPDMLPHYVRDHRYQPPADFVDAVLNVEFSGGERRQTRSAQAPEQVGYLTGEFPSGEVPEGFLEKLARVMQLASGLGQRLQTKGLKFQDEPVLRGAPEE